MLEGTVDRAAPGAPPGGQLQTAVTVASNMMWTAFRSTISGVVTHVVPDHTRDACFQLFCDLRANTPKDGRFLQRHTRALMPHTAPGWLAMSSALGFSFAGLVALACTTVAISIAGVGSLVGLALASGVFLGSVLVVLAFSLFVAALVSGAMASGALMMYVAVSATLACLRLTSRLLLGSPRPQRQSSEAPHGVSSGQEPPGLVMPVIRTKPPPALPKSHTLPAASPSASASASAAMPAPAAGPCPGSPTSATAGSPRCSRLNPAAAAAAALAEAAEPHSLAAPAVPDSVCAPALGPQSATPGSGLEDNGVTGGHGPTSSRSGSEEPAPGVEGGGKAAIHVAAGSSTPPAAAFGAPRTPTAPAAAGRSGGTAASTAAGSM